MTIDTVDLLKHVGETTGFTGIEINVSVAEFFEVVSELKGREILFENCDFNFVNGESNIDTYLEKKITFNGCTFKNAVVWERLFFASQYTLNPQNTAFVFANCVFDNTICFNEIDSRYDKKINFINCKLQHVYFENLKSGNSKFSICFSKCKAQSIVISEIDKLLLCVTDSMEIGKLAIVSISEKIEICTSFSKIRELAIESIGGVVAIDTDINTQYLKIIDCQKITKPLSINIDCECELINSTFEAEFGFWEGIGQEKGAPIVARDCIFNDTVNFSTFGMNRSHITIEDSTFRKKLWIGHSSIDKLVFRNCNFEDTVKIFHFADQAICNLKNQIKYADFSMSTIKSLFLFNDGGDKRLCLERETTIDFSNIFIEPSGYLIIRNVNDDKNYNGNFKFCCANILGNVVFSDVYANSLDLEHSSIVGNFNVEKTEFNDYVNSQTLVKLKNEAIKKNDTIKALEYKGEEMVKYRGELRKKGIFKNLKERFLITLNTCSNNNGQSWTRGLVFTLGLAVFFCLLLDFGAESRIYCTWNGWDSCKIIFERFLAVINIFHFETDSESASEALKLNIGGNYIFFLSKIVVGYGIYQTIAAFRKYGKQ